MAKELYYFVNRTSEECELLEKIETWLKARYDYDTINELMWLYHNDVAFLADGVEVSWDDYIEDYILREGDSLSSYHFSVDDLRAHDVLMETNDQYAFEDYIKYNTRYGDLLKFIDLSKYDKYYIITA